MSTRDARLGRPPRARADHPRTPALPWRSGRLRVTVAQLVVVPSERPTGLTGDDRFDGGGRSAPVDRPQPCAPLIARRGGRALQQAGRTYRPYGLAHRPQTRAAKAGRRPSRAGMSARDHFTLPSKRQRRWAPRVAGTHALRLRLLFQGRPRMARAVGTFFTGRAVSSAASAFAASPLGRSDTADISVGDAVLTSIASVRRQSARRQPPFSGPRLDARLYGPLGRHGQRAERSQITRGAVAPRQTRQRRADCSYPCGRAPSGIAVRGDAALLFRGGGVNRRRARAR